jgi:hypothetical protein
MKQFLLTGFLVITFFNLSLAQGELEPGYLVKVDGDTVSGYIIYEVDSKLSERVKSTVIKKRKSRKYLNRLI